ncbi:MAG: hypothetical protein P8Y07_05200 [Gemmatimonadales bacterium]
MARRPGIRALVLIEEAEHALRSLEHEEVGADRSLREALRLLQDAGEAAERVETERDLNLRTERVRQLEAVRIGRPQAHERFKLDAASRYTAALSLAVLIHAGALAFLPGLDAPDLRSRASALLALDLPPYLQIPPPPEAITKPARPVVTAVEIDESVTIGPTTFAANPVQLRGPRMREMQQALADRPTFVAYTQAPELTNRDEVIYYLSELYPPWARKARVRASVLLLPVHQRGGRRPAEGDRGFERARGPRRCGGGGRQRNGLDAGPEPRPCDAGLADAAHHLLT